MKEGMQPSIAISLSMHRRGKGRAGGWILHVADEITRKQGFEVFFERKDCLSHLRQVVPLIVDRFDFSLNRCGVIDKTFGNFRRRADLSVDTAIRSSEIMQPPLRHAVVEFFLKLTPAGYRPLVRDAA